MKGKQRRIIREEKTVAAMISIYCRHIHNTPVLCPDCRELLAYSRERLLKCPFGEGKTTCSNCKVHCYKPGMREKIKAVMRYSGPRMIYRHPVLTVYYMFDRRRKEPLALTEENGK
jgi:hypothetical protein